MGLKNLPRWVVMVAIVAGNKTALQSFQPKYQPADDRKRQDSGQTPPSSPISFASDRRCMAFRANMSASFQQGGFFP